MPLNNWNIVTAEGQNVQNKANLQFNTTNTSYGMCGTAQPLFQMQVMMNNETMLAKSCCIDPQTKELQCMPVQPFMQKK